MCLHTFGTGQYGDLASTIVVIFLDKEARTVVLDKDISSGMLRESILKVTSLVQSMDFVSNQRIIKMQNLKTVHWTDGT